MKCFASPFAVTALASLVTGTANAVFLTETASLAEVTPSTLTSAELPNPFFYEDSRIGFSTQFELNLVKTQHAMFSNTEPNVRASAFGPSGPSPLPEFPTILAGLLLLVPLGASTLRILMKRSAA